MIADTLADVDPRITLSIAAVVYLIPSIVAALRGHRNLLPVMVVNVLLGWTLVGWVVAMVWSLLARPEIDVREPRYVPRRRYARR